MVPGADQPASLAKLMSFSFWERSCHKKISCQPLVRAQSRPHSCTHTACVKYLAQGPGFPCSVNANSLPSFTPAPRISQEHKKDDWQLIQPEPQLTCLSTCYSLRIKNTFKGRKKSHHMRYSSYSSKHRVRNVQLDIFQSNSVL